MLRKEYCSFCDEERNITIKEENIKMNIKGIEFVFDGNIAYCSVCGNEVYIAELDEENIRKANDKYRELIGIIKVEEIEKLLEKYNLGKEPLAKLLGWGEKTIVRYCNGLMPSKLYSDKLIELFDQNKMKELFEKNKEVLTDVAIKKFETTINKDTKHYQMNDANIDLASISNFLVSKYGYGIKIDRFDKKGHSCWVVIVPELPGCISYGDSLNEALYNVDVCIEDWINDAKKKGTQVPKPRIKKARDNFDGNINLSISKELHRDIALKAEYEETSINDLLIFLITKALYSTEGNKFIQSIRKIIKPINEEWVQYANNSFLNTIAHIKKGAN